jgi:hypothetical protein
MSFEAIYIVLLKDAKCDYVNTYMSASLLKL